MIAFCFYFIFILNFLFVVQLPLFLILIFVCLLLHCYYYFFFLPYVMHCLDLCMQPATRLIAVFSPSLKIYWKRKTSRAAAGLTLTLLALHSHLTLIDAPLKQYFILPAAPRNLISQHMYVSRSHGNNFFGFYSLCMHYYNCSVSRYPCKWPAHKCIII